VLTVLKVRDDKARPIGFWPRSLGDPWIERIPGWRLRTWKRQSGSCAPKV